MYTYKEMLCYTILRCYSSEPSIVVFASRNIRHFVHNFYNLYNSRLEPYAELIKERYCAITVERGAVTTKNGANAISLYVYICFICMCNEIA